MRYLAVVVALLLASACSGNEAPEDEALTLGQSCPQLGLSLLDDKGSGLEQLRAAGQLRSRLADLAKSGDAETKAAIKPLRLALTDMLDNDGREVGAESAVDDAVADVRLACEDAGSTPQ